MKWEQIIKIICPRCDVFIETRLGFGDEILEIRVWCCMQWVAVTCPTPRFHENEAVAVAVVAVVVVVVVVVVAAFDVDADVDDGSASCCRRFYCCRFCFDCFDMTVLTLPPPPCVRIRHELKVDRVVHLCRRHHVLHGKVSGKNEKGGIVRQSAVVARHTRGRAYRGTISMSAHEDKVIGCLLFLLLLSMISR